MLDLHGVIGSQNGFDNRTSKSGRLDHGENNDYIGAATFNIGVPEMPDRRLNFSSLEYDYTIEIYRNDGSYF